MLYVRLSCGTPCEVMILKWLCRKDGWWLAEDASGNIGVVPKTLVEVNIIFGCKYNDLNHPIKLHLKRSRKLAIAWFSYWEAARNDKLLCLAKLHARLLIDDDTPPRPTAKLWFKPISNLLKKLTIALAHVKRLNLNYTFFSQSNRTSLRINESLKINDRGLSTLSK